MIATKFRGTIDFISKWNKGSTFFFTFEVVPFDLEAFLQEEAAEKIQSSPRKPKQSLKTPSQISKTNCDEPDLTPIIKAVEMQKKLVSTSRILVVDDEEFCLSSMRAILGRLGVDIDFAVDFCMSGEEAVELAQLAQDYNI
mmetsp:Transcript_33670/g.51996  ORF Transcript_33670/g.51996 Transcript_33670/m.51996 type:complete len:141 (-) Transcript_33670:215-637(-)